MNKYIQNKKELGNKVIEINNNKAVIVGVGKKAIKFAILAPKGFSTKQEKATFFVNIDDMSEELKKALNAFIPNANNENEKNKDEKIINLLS